MVTGFYNRFKSITAENRLRHGDTSLVAEHGDVTYNRTIVIGRLEGDLAAIDCAVDPYPLNAIELDQRLAAVETSLAIKPPKKKIIDIIPDTSIDGPKKDASAGAAIWVVAILLFVILIVGLVFICYKRKQDAGARGPIPMINAMSNLTIAKVGGTTNPMYTGDCGGATATLSREKVRAPLSIVVACDPLWSSLAPLRRHVRSFVTSCLPLPAGLCSRYRRLQIQIPLRRPIQLSASLSLCLCVSVSLCLSVSIEVEGISRVGGRQN
jgi:hypothetical protein